MIHTKLQAHIDKSFHKTKAKYAVEIASGAMIVEKQTRKHCYTQVLFIFLAVFTLLFCEFYFFDYLAEQIATCKLFFGIFPYYWLPICLSFIFTGIVVWFTYQARRNYKQCIKTGYVVDDRKSSVFVKVLVKPKLWREKVRFYGISIILITSCIFILNTCNTIIVQKTDKSFASLSLIQEQSLVMQQKCLAKLKN